MQQLTYTAPNEIEWRDVEPPALEGPGDALVEPLAVASCDLDPWIVTGRTPYPPPIALGHEAIGRVVDVADGVSAVRPGDVVAVPFQVSCGECAACRRGRTGNCATVAFLSMYGFGKLGGDWGGALSDLVRVPFADHMLVQVPEGIDPVAAASLSDNIVDAWRAVAPQLAAEPRAEVLVVGGGAGGSIGLYAAGIAEALGAGGVDYVDRDADRLARAERLGARACEWGEDRLGPYPITVDSSGEPDGLRLALRSTASDGFCTSTAIYFEPETGLPLLEMYTRNVTFHTGRVHARACMPDALRLVEDGSFKPELVTSKVVPWHDAGEALLSAPGKLVFSRSG